MKKILSLLLAVCMLFALVACGGEKKDDGKIEQIKFSQSVEELQKLDDKKVEIRGFMSLLSPLNGELIYLMNVPLQSCPFCLPNTNTLSNTIAVKGKNIEFTTQPVKIVGDLVFGDFADSYGYEYDYRIENAEITVLDEAEISKEMKVYYTVSQEEFLSQIYFLLGCIDQIAFHEDYEIKAEEFDEYGTIPFEEYETMMATLKSLNADGEYNDFITLVEETKAIIDELNTAITNKEYDKYKTYRDRAEALFTKFNDFINKYEF